MSKSSPSRLWYGVAALAAIAGVLVAVALLMPSRGGALGQRFELGTPVEVRLSSDPLMIWAQNAGQAPELDCEADEVDVSMQEISVVSMQSPVTAEFDGSTWRGMATVEAEPAGRYQVTCESINGVSAPLAIGEAPTLNVGRNRVLGTVALIALLGLAVAVTAVVAVKRRPVRSPS